MDLRAAADRTLEPGERCLMPTGFAVALPEGFEAQVRPRSGLAVSHGVTVLNAPGTVDCDYRGEISVPLINHGASRFAIRRGERIAQLVVAPIARARLVEVERPRRDGARRRRLRLFGHAVTLPMASQRRGAHALRPPHPAQGSGRDRDRRELKAASVLVIGAGGLGSPVLMYLAAAGVGRLGIVDDDRVSLSNLQRQIVHGTANVGEPKTASAKSALAQLNPHVEVVAHRGSDEGRQCARYHRRL